MTARLSIFAKAPIAGDVKSRLQPALNAEQAASVAKVLMFESVRRFREIWSGPVDLWAWPNIHHDTFAQVARHYDIDLLNQVEGNLGDKMLAALDYGLSAGSPTAVIGADIPDVDLRMLARAQTLLNSGTAVYGPTRDGGFWLLGLTYSVPDLFKGVPWSQSDTGARVLARANLLGLKFDMLAATVNDIDTIDDLDQALNQDAVLRNAMFTEVAGLRAMLRAWRAGKSYQR